VVTAESFAPPRDWGGGQPHGDAFEGITDGLVIHLALLAPGREDGRLVEQVGQVGTGETGSAAGPVGH